MTQTMDRPAGNLPARQNNGGGSRVDQIESRIDRQAVATIGVSAQRGMAVDSMGQAMERAARKQAEDDAEAAQLALLTALGDAEGGTYSKGQITYYESSRKGYTVEPCTFRQLRVKPAK